MKTTRLTCPVLQLTLMVLTLSAIIHPLSTSYAQGTAFTYQGRLNDGTNPAAGTYDLRFTLFDASSGGSVMAGPTTNGAVAVSEGLFTVTLDFGAGVFNGTSRWLEISVRTNGAGSFTKLNPRQLVTPEPYAIMAGEVTSTNIPRLTVSNTSVQATGHPIVTSGFVTGAIVDSGGAGYLTAPSVVVSGTGSGAVITSAVSNGVVVSLTVQNAGAGYSNTTTLTIGTPPPHTFQEFGSSNYFSGVNTLTNQFNVFAGDGSGLTGVWLTDGNTSPKIPTTDFIGRLDNQPLEFRVNNRRALVLAPTTNNIPNMVAGFSNNAVGPGATGSTITGGGQPTLPNQVRASMSTIAGGSGNVISNFADGSFISAGFLNSITSNYFAAIGGGGGNIIGAFSSSGLAIGPSGPLGNTIAGGFNNAIGNNSGGGVVPTVGYKHGNTIGGGSDNLITTNAIYATIPGGVGNTAAGNFSFAAGESANALHDGAFVWADSQGSAFSSTAANQFLIRASGGVGIGTASPQGDLHVNGNTVLQGLVTPLAAAATNLLNIGSGVTPDGFRNGISFYEGGNATAMSFGYDGAGGASQNALRIYHSSGSPLFTFQANGNLGIGTTNPLTALHAVDTGDAQISIQSGDTNSHRWALQSSGVTGNVALDGSFQIIDRTLNKPRLYIGTNGNVGVGTTVSVVPLTIRATGSAIEWLTLTSTNDTARWQINEFGGGLNFAQSSVTDGRLFLANNGNAGIGTITPTNKLHVAGGVSATAFVNTSDRNAKENFAPVNACAVLDKVATLPILTWNYKEMRDGRHMGPTAQDFHAAFGLGGSDKTITTVDPDGVALAAIQGLNEKVETKARVSEHKIRALEAENADLRRRLEALEEAILEKQSN
jgi:hypothetical protein